MMFLVYPFYIAAGLALVVSAAFTAAGSYSGALTAIVLGLVIGLIANAFAHSEVIREVKEQYNLHNIDNAQLRESILLFNDKVNLLKDEVVRGNRIGDSINDKIKRDIHARKRAIRWFMSQHEGASTVQAWRRWALEVDHDCDPK